MATIAGDSSVYNKNTDFDNEAKYLQGLISNGTTGEKDWATKQYDALIQAAVDNAQPADTGIDKTQNTQSVINQMYDNYIASQIGQANSNYTQNLNALNNAESKVGAQYATQRDNAADQSAQAQQAFNEYALARGLNTGAGAQSALARQNAYQGALSDLNTAEAQTYADIATQKANLLSEYNAAVAEAQMTGNFNKASALSTELARLDSQNQSALSAQNATLSDAGWTLLGTGVMPSAEQLSAMGMTPDQAAAYMAANYSAPSGYSGGGSYSGNGGYDAGANVLDNKPEADTADSTGNGMIYIPGFGYVSYDKAEQLELSGRVFMVGIDENGDPIYRVVQQGH